MDKPKVKRTSKPKTVQFSDYYISSVFDPASTLKQTDGIISEVKALPKSPASNTFFAVDQSDPIYKFSKPANAQLQAPIEKEILIPTNTENQIPKVYKTAEKRYSIGRHQ